MIHTETDARTRWCPMARVGDSASNRWSTSQDEIGINLAGCMCVGPACMLWVADAPIIEYSIIPDSAKTPGAPPPGEGWYIGVTKTGHPQSAWCRVRQKTGYCGLIKK